MTLKLALRSDLVCCALLCCVTLQKSNSKYGNEHEAVAVYSMMRGVEKFCPIYTLCIGNAFGEAALLLAAGTKVSQLNSNTSMPHHAPQTHKHTFAAPQPHPKPAVARTGAELAQLHPPSRPPARLHGCSCLTPTHAFLLMPLCPCACLGVPPQGKRAALRSSTIMIRQPLQRLSGMQASDIDIYRRVTREKTHTMVRDAQRGVLRQKHST